MESAKKKNAPKRFGCVKILLIGMGLLMFLCSAITFIRYYGAITHDDWLNRNGLRGEIAAQHLLAERLPLSETSIEAVRTYMSDEGVRCYRESVDERNSHKYYISCAIDIVNLPFDGINEIAKWNGGFLTLFFQYAIGYSPTFYITYTFFDGMLDEIKTHTYYPYI